jgi:hypothetical protein
MKRTENECADCGMPCKGHSCPHYRVTRYYCDRCGDETKLYHYEGEELCIGCIEEALEEVEGSV